MNLPELATKPTSPDPETGVLAFEIAKAFRDMVQFYEKSRKLSHEQALEKMREDNPEYLEQIFTYPPDELRWGDLQHVARHCPQKALELWEQVKQVAREELRSGHRMAQAIVVGDDRCWARARFLVLREELLEGWQPTNALERQLVETLAQAQAAYLHWLETLTTWTSLTCDEEAYERKGDGTWTPPRLAKADAIDKASSMVDRFHRIMMRTLRTLRDLRRYAPKIIVRNAKQVNMGEQQVNVLGR
jgi:hypothetical protein